MEVTYVHSFSEIKAVENNMFIFSSNLSFLYSGNPTTSRSWNTNPGSNPHLLNIKKTWVNSCCLSTESSTELGPPGSTQHKPTAT